jgi:hypothetical protein
MFSRPILYKRRELHELSSGKIFGRTSYIVRRMYSMSCWNIFFHYRSEQSIYMHTLFGGRIVIGRIKRGVRLLSLFSRTILDIEWI